jgi:hypothetical protein
MQGGSGVKSRGFSADTTVMGAQYAHVLIPLKQYWGIITYFLTPRHSFGNNLRWLGYIHTVFHKRLFAKSNATLQAPLEAGATQERTL